MATRWAADGDEDGDGEGGACLADAFLYTCGIDAFVTIRGASGSARLAVDSSREECSRPDPSPAPAPAPNPRVIISSSPPSPRLSLSPLSLSLSEVSGPGEMYQWRKFDFFEEKSPGKASVPANLTGRIECCSSGRGRIAVACDDGTVGLLDRGFKLLYAFNAHSSSLHFLQHLKQRNFLVTVGEDERTSPQTPSTCLKLFDLDKMQPEGSSTAGPECLQILRVFTTQFPEAEA